jgi:quinol monooxygenase YgiN
MHILHVQVRVKPEFVEAFRAVTVENAHRSRQEPGVARFDVIQQTDDPTRFLLVEVYRAPEGHARHRETAHYQQWRETVASMMAGPRAATTYREVSPDDHDG